METALKASPSRSSFTVIYLSSQNQLKKYKLLSFHSCTFSSRAAAAHTLLLHNTASNVDVYNISSLSESTRVKLTAADNTHKAHV